MRPLVRDAFVVIDAIALVYFLTINSVYLVLITLASIDGWRYFRRRPYTTDEAIFSSPLTPSVSVIVPAHNEEAGIVDSIHSLLGLVYPDFEIVVVEDGSTDRTFEVLQEEFDLIPSNRVWSTEVKLVGEILSIYEPRNGEPIVVARKVGAHRKTDSNNAGLNVARKDLICMVDADSVVDEMALIKVVKPFVDDPQRVIGTGGSIRVANGTEIANGRVIKPAAPKSWLARIQVVEYLRAFLLGRTGWSRLQGILIISGAFGLFRRDLIIQIGGYDESSMGEDAELVTRLHKILRNVHRDYRIVFVPEPVCWTEVPEKIPALASQRRRWSRGITETLWAHRDMIFNPRYGRIGLVVLPYYLFFECLGAAVEVFGVLIVALGLALHLVAIKFAILIALISVGYGIFLSLMCIVVEELSFQKYCGFRDMMTTIAAAFLENIGYRQLHAWWRLQGLFDAIRHKEAHWQVLTKTGFKQSVDSGTKSG